MISGDIDMRIAQDTDAEQARPSAPHIVPLLKLSSFEQFDADDKDAIQMAVSDRVTVPRHERIAAAGEVKVAIGTGIAGDCRTFRDGRRQIVRLFLAGDFLPEGTAAQTIFSLGSVETIQFAASSDAWARPAIATAVAHARVVDEALFHRWVATLGGRPAEVRIGHLLQEMYWRLSRIGQASDLRFQLPLTQQDLADITGLSLVHTNKSLKNLACAGILRMRFSNVEICDPEALGRLTELDPEACVQSSRSQSDLIPNAVGGSLRFMAERKRPGLALS